MRVSDPITDLKALAERPPDPVRDSELYAELFRVARRLRESRRKVIGLLPTGPTVAVPPIALQLGFVLADVSEGTVALIDANTQHPGLSTLVPQSERDDAHAGFAMTWLADFFMLLTPVSDKLHGLELEPLERVLREECAYYAHVLIDLTGFERIGEHWGAYEAVDAVLLLEHPGTTPERDLLRLHREIPASKSLGTLLVG